MAFDKSKLSIYEQGGYCAMELLFLVEKLGIARFPSVNPEDLDEYSWRVHEQEINKVKD